ncbi:HNH/ENDO VII family nuclease [Clostridium thailandense]|uniref:HNH/ENDO VII family nuclease n=1 Tax=Clostridium thailandense TaxID=2794346 RepID=UPI003989CCB5
MAVLETIVAVAEKAGTAAVETTKKIAEPVKNISEAGVKEVAKSQVENIKSAGDAVLSKLEDIKNLTPEQLRERMEENLEKEDADVENNSEADDSDENAKEGLTDEEKAKIEEETGWSDEIIDAIGSMEEYEIYKNAGLQEAEIGGRRCLIRSDIDWERKDAFGKTNRERAAEGHAPLDKNGKPIQLHHIGQHADSPLAELTFEEHRCGGNDSILHDKTKETEVHGEGSNWDSERGDYWKARAEDERSSNNE